MSSVRYGEVNADNKDPLPSPLMSRETHHIIKFKSSPMNNTDSKKGSPKSKEKRRLRGFKKLLGRQRKKPTEENKKEDVSSVVRGRSRKSNVVVTVHTNDVETVPSPLKRGRSLSRSTSFKQMVRRSMSITSDPTKRVRSRSNDVSSVHSSNSLGDRLRSRVRSFRRIRSMSRQRKSKSKNSSKQNAPHQRVLFVKQTHSPAAVTDFSPTQTNDESFDLSALCGSLDSFSLCKNIFGDDEEEIIGKVIGSEDNDNNSILTPT